jgi:hypothetical protein
VDDIPPSSLGFFVLVYKILTMKNKTHRKVLLIFTIFRKKLKFFN